MTGDKSRRIVEHTLSRIAKVTPPGFGKEDAPWAATAPAAASFMTALRAWEQADSPATRAQLQQCADALVAAWREAAA